ncbi:hypothetical protein CesoFtcFv8_027771 [Champsocephalus esox]|uniref:Uncharacterized protein n=1 Tax=Champsocephalus esox TaxID=159716 RepID=A0AAN8G7U2_9TELE|nr:hypothetical protein CesoFtcFv8_027771 [Champsocephalus esox]
MTGAVPVQIVTPISASKNLPWRSVHGGIRDLVGKRRETDDKGLWTSDHPWVRGQEHHHSQMSSLTDGEAPPRFLRCCLGSAVPSAP